MTLAGTRPILQDELLKYELHHRARIAIKPGITGMWQVSGRSDITDFEEVVRLDVFFGISTSGNSKNVLYAAVTAHAKGMKVIGLTGAKNSKLEQMSDVCIKVPQTETYMIQELHLPVYHCLCLMLEERFFSE